MTPLRNSARPSPSVDNQIRRYSNVFSTPIISRSVHCFRIFSILDPVIEINSRVIGTLQQRMRDTPRPKRSIHARLSSIRDKKFPHSGSRRDRAVFWAAGFVSINFDNWPQSFPASLLHFRLARPGVAEARWVNGKEAGGGRRGGDASIQKAGHITAITVVRNSAMVQRMASTCAFSSFYFSLPSSPSLSPRSVTICSYSRSKSATMLQWRSRT